MSFLESRMLESCLDTTDVFDARHLSVSQHDENLHRKRREQQLLMEARIRNIKKNYQQKYEQVHSDYLLQCEQLKQQLQSEIKREMYTFECNIETFITKQLQGAELSRINPNYSSYIQNNPLNSTFHIEGEAAGNTPLNDFRPYRSQSNNNCSKNADLDSSIIFNTSQNNVQADIRRTMLTQTVPSQFGSFQEDEDKHTYQMAKPDYILRTHFNESQENIFDKTSISKDCYQHLAKTTPASGSAFEKMRASSSAAKKQTPNIRHILGEKTNNRIQFSENTTPQAWVRSPEWGTSGKKGFDLSWNLQKQQLQQSGLFNQGGFMSASNKTTVSKQNNYKKQQQKQQQSQNQNISYDENTFRSKEKQSLDLTRSKLGQYQRSNQQFSDSDSEEENKLDTMRLRRFKIENLNFSSTGVRGGKNQRLQSAYK